MLIKSKILELKDKNTWTMRKIFKNITDNGHIF